MARTPSDLSGRVEDLTSAAWLLAALAAAAGRADLSDEHGALLAAAGYAERTPQGWQLRPEHRAVLADRNDPDAFRRRIARLLRQAADAAEGRGGRPPEDDATLVAEGEASGVRMGELLDLLTVRVPGFGDLLRREDLRFLDVGTGIGAIAATVVDRVPGARAVGLDIEPRALRLADVHLSSRGLRDRVELRGQDVAELAEDDAYDLAWLPLAVIAPDSATRALPRVRAALRPGGWLIGATALRDAAGERAGAVRAVIRWRMALSGITTWDADELVRRLIGAGFCDVREVETPPRSVALIAARAPA